MLAYLVFSWYGNKRFGRNLRITFIIHLKQQFPYDNEFNQCGGWLGPRKLTAFIYRLLLTWMHWV